ncbi:hypothetical protein BX666DRAFT_1933332 [Dichotomocladium elegans]|nr:hypothetical protein BX666DRAFT_1933332 [Dichotomocladium elegans]
MKTKSIKRQDSASSPAVDEKPLKSRFFSESAVVDVVLRSLPTPSREDGSAATFDVSLTWKSAPRPIGLEMSAITTQLRMATEQPLLPEEEGDDEDKDYLKETLLESQKIETVQKESFFSEELTEDERQIVAKRVALQQRQFMQYQKREKKRKSKKIRAMFEHVTDEEIEEMLLDCEEDEDEVIYRLTKPGYLSGIRKQIASKYKHEDRYGNRGTTMDAAQKAAYLQLLKKRSGTLKKTTNDEAKKQYRMGGRLGLDEALQQVQKHKVDPEKAFEGWSQARIRAYQMINENPNSYFYRFNAPGEVQRRGQWTKEEQQQFFDRLEEVGANGQWGIFSMTIPGRVGYQCSNFYRLLLETKQITDPNYVLDERGKARYLFDKKDANGNVRKGFRTHRPIPIGEPSSSGSAGGSGTGSSRAASSVRSTAAANTTTSSTTVTRARTRASANADEVQKARRRPTPQQQQRRRRRAHSSDGEEDELVYSSDDLFDDNEDRSGHYTSRIESTQEEDTRRRSKRQRRPTAAAIEAGLASVAHADIVPWSETVSNTSGADEDVLQSITNTRNDKQHDNPLNPLPGFIDPITLEEVIKPAISKYGHVMGYDSWVRCLTRWQGKQNVCPLTKKPLTKRDLVILDFDNIEEYRSRIVNL